MFLVAELRLEANDPDAEEMDAEILDETDDIEDTREWLEADDIEEADDDEEAEEADEAEDWDDPEEDPDEALRRLDFRSVKERGYLDSVLGGGLTVTRTVDAERTTSEVTGGTTLTIYNQSNSLQKKLPSSQEQVYSHS